MHSKTTQHDFPERVFRQVKADSRRALVRSGWCPDQSRIDNLRCADDVLETDAKYGRQLWLFEAHGVDVRRERNSMDLFGAIEYSVQYGTLEPIEDRVFEHPHERQRLLRVYQGFHPKPGRGWRLLMWSIVLLMVGCTLGFVGFLGAAWFDR
jgi:hypothetical protein